MIATTKILKFNVDLKQKLDKELLFNPIFELKLFWSQLQNVGKIYIFFLFIRVFDCLVNSNKCTMQVKITKMATTQ